jgi:hypothetical protein
MKKILFFLFLNFVFLMSSCKKENLCDCLKGTGSMVKEKRSVDNFTIIEVHKNIFVTIIQDTVTFVEVEAGKNLLPLIKTDVRSGLLYITNDNTCNWVRSYEKEIHVYVHVKNLFEISSYSGRDITSSNTITSPVLFVHNFFSGNIFLDISTNESYTKQRGSGGDITITGHTDYNYIFSQGYGFVHLEKLQSNTATVSQNGTGDIHLNVRNSMDVEITGSGNVYYSGNPSINQHASPGSGKLIRE